MVTRILDSIPLMIYEHGGMIWLTNKIFTIKGDLNTATTATAAVSALVATSSFISPAGDIGADVTKQLIRMSTMCNILSNICVHVYVYHAGIRVQ